MVYVGGGRWGRGELCQPHLVRLSQKEKAVSGIREGPCIHPFHYKYLAFHPFFPRFVSSFLSSLCLLA